MWFNLLKFLPLLLRLVPGIVLRSFLLGPFAVACAILSYCLLSGELKYDDVIWGLLFTIFGGLFTGFAILFASLTVFVPILWIEIQSGKPAENGPYLFKKYLPVICLLTLITGLFFLLVVNDSFTVPVELIGALISFHLTGSLALWLFSRAVSHTF